jgi:hypothetical protein
MSRGISTNCMVASNKRFWKILVLTFCLSLGSVTALAQETVELNPIQADLNNQAVQALQETPPDAHRAIQLLNAALVSGDEADILYLTLGRAHQLAGQCDEAIVNYVRVETAPGVTGLPRDQVRARLLLYRTEIEATCPGTLIVNCSDSNTKLRIEGIPEAYCNTPLTASPKRYLVEAELDSMTTAIEVVVNGWKKTEITIGLGGDNHRILRAFERATDMVERAAASADRTQKEE